MAPLSPVRPNTGAATHWMPAAAVVGGEALHADLGEFGGEVGQGDRLPVGSAGGQFDVAGQAVGLEPGEAGLADGGQVGREAGADRARELDPQRGRVLLAQVEDFGAVEDRVVRGDVQCAGQAGEFGCHGAGGAGGPQVRRADLECLQADRVGGRRGHGHEGFAGQVAQDGVGGALGYVELAGDLGERHRRLAVCQPVEDSRRPDDRGAHDAPFSRLRGWLIRPAACPRDVPAGPGVHRLPPGVTLSGVRAGPDTSLPECVHIYNCRSHLRRNLDIYRNGVRASADDFSEIPPDPRSRAGRGGCCPGGFGDGGVLVRAVRSREELYSHGRGVQPVHWPGCVIRAGDDGRAA